MQPINSGGEHDTVHDGHDVLKRTVRLSAAAIISSNGLIWMRQNQRFLNGVSNSKLMSFSSHNVKMKALTALSLRHGPHARRVSRDGLFYYWWLFRNLVVLVVPRPLVKLTRFD